MYAVRGVDDAEPLLRRIRRAIKHKHPVTLTYRKASGEVTVRTVEPWAVEVNRERTGVFMRTYDRETSEVRTFRLDRIIFYSVHRSSRVIENEYEALMEEVTP